MRPIGNWVSFASCSGSDSLMPLRAGGMLENFKRRVYDIKIVIIIN